MIVTESVRDFERELDHLRLAEHAALTACRAARSRDASTARRELRTAQTSTIEAERALTAAMGTTR